MKFYLTLLRHEGKRIAPERVVQVGRLVSIRLGIVKGLQRLTAICCFGGETVAELWDPVLACIAEEHIILRGIEGIAEAGMLQEWRLRPHPVGPPG